jgi:exosortase D (VPLPA-CTERM-specific)
MLNERPVYRLAPATWLMLAVVAALLWMGFESSLRFMLGIWLGREEYSHGILIPFIAMFLVWQQRDFLSRERFEPSWAGVAVTLAGAAVHVVGQLAALQNISQYGFLLCVYGLILALVGWRVAKRLVIALLILVLMIPLPLFLLNNFSAALQLISSRLGVAFMRLFGVTVYLEGNVIDLGVYQLQVAEACDGLRYLFPLMTLGLLMAYLFKAAFWKRALLFVSSIPVSILMNSLRVGVIGILVEHWGIGMAEGFLHDFQGWAVFMVSAGLLLLELMLLARIGRNPRPWRQTFGLELPAPIPRDARREFRRPTVTFYCSGAIVAALTALSLTLPHRVEAIPQRASLIDFPMVIGAWRGSRESLDPIFLDTLKLDDYLMADYVGPQGRPLNLYVAWYDSQRAGRSAHSPRSCLPGGGWQIESFSQFDVPGVSVGGRPLRVNRALIQMGNRKQLVYYWFQQRGRVATNEYQVKWYLFWDSLTRQRTDGALVRLSVPFSHNESGEAAERELGDFLQTIAPRLHPFVPD